MDWNRLPDGCQDRSTSRLCPSVAEITNYLSEGIEGTAARGTCRNSHLHEATSTAVDERQESCGNGRAVSHCEGATGRQTRSSTGRKKAKAGHALAAGIILFFQFCFDLFFQFLFLNCFLNLFFEFVFWILFLKFLFLKCFFWIFGFEIVFWFFLKLFFRLFLNFFVFTSGNCMRCQARTRAQDKGPA